MNEIGLYIHIPFCKSKCYYCDFNSYSNKERIQEEYIDCLIKEMRIRSSILNKYKICSVYIGGGTPTYLNFNALNKLLSYVKSIIGENVEYTCEANPGTLSYDKLFLLRNSGVNRLSIGLQSWNDEILKKLGRIHNIDDFINNFRMARSIGFNNINIDLMFSIHGQTIDDFENTLNNVIRLNPEHISCYSLIIEEGTIFYDQVREGKLKEIDEDTDRDMYYLATQKLKKSGYIRYEISNYAREGYECLHNKLYWKTKEYLGVGAGAHSYIDNARFSNERIPEKYMDAIKNSNLPVCSKEELSENESMSEFMFMGLRMMEGVSFDDFKQRFKKEILDVYGNQIEGLGVKKLVKIKENRLMLTVPGIDLSNQVFVEFLK